VILGLFRLTDRVAIVTGAGKGIGRGIALAFAEAGADVVCAARTQADIDAVADEVRRCGRRALAVRTDVMQTADLDALVQATLAEFGRIDVLVNNAGGTMPRAALDTSERFFEEALRFNATSAFLLSRMVVRKMVETRFSRPPRTLVLAGADGGAICGGYDVTTRTAAAKRLSSATGCSGRSAARPAAEPERWADDSTQSISDSR
jgi:NAD(P)-dependent dehydrogenase (short-subunit alcohol dehydrogenase family)